MKALLLKRSRLLLFGILATFFSAPGQVYLISFFIPPMREELGFSKTAISALFFFGTLGSAFLLPVLGVWLDRVRPLVYVGVTGVLLAAGCVTLGVAHGAVALLAGFFLVRNFGQGGLALAAQTMMARLEDEHRGKALGIANLGYPLSEAILPGLVSAVIVVFGWRAGWMMLAASFALIFLPALPYLIRHEPHPRFPRHAGEILPAPPERESWTVRRVLRDRGFQLLLIPVLATPAFLTALFFHHAAVMEWKDWDPLLLPAGFTVYAACRAVVSFFSGPLTDRFTAKKIFVWNLVPLGIGIAALWLPRDPFWIFVYFAGAGTTMGYGMTVGNALYAELYGTGHLGAIRGMISFAIVLTTAVAPFVMGILLDAGLNPAVILCGMVLLITAATGCAFMALKPA